MDVAASQIVIEALVVEINTNKAKELGFTIITKRKINITTKFSTTLDFNGNCEGIDGSQYKFNRFLILMKIKISISAKANWC